MNKHPKLLIPVYLQITFCILLSDYSYATVNIGGSKAPAKSPHSIMASGCSQDEGAAVLNVNNIRVRIMDEGDMWWNPGTTSDYYFAPANGKVSAQFAGALWIGGYDAGGQLKEAAMTYRQNGEDFWAGPIDTCPRGNTSISVAECRPWDKCFFAPKAEVVAFHTKYPGTEL